MAARKPREPDPPEALDRLRSDLESAGLLRGYVLRGEELYFRERAIDALKARAVADGYEICLHDASTKTNPDFRLSGLIDDLTGTGLFAPRRLVVVRHPEDALAKAGKADAPLTSAVLRFLETPDDVGSIVLSAVSLRVDHPVARAVQKRGGRILSLRKLWDGPPPWDPDPRKAELVRWALRRARDLGVRLDPDKAVYVCAATGNDLAALDDQLERLRTAPGSAVDDVVGWDARIAPWSVADQLLGGDVPRALAGVETLFRGGFQDRTGRRVDDSTGLATILIGSLMRGVRQGLVLASELERGRDENEVARSVGLIGRAAGPALARARRRPPKEWRCMLDDVAALERSAKSAAGVDANDFCVLALRWNARTAPANHA